VTIVTFSRMVGYSLEAAKALEKEGISVEVINLRCVVALLLCRLKLVVEVADHVQCVLRQVELLTPL
jgi:pyruvate/2-oxoglutarate/acetoin dehydrogenase E1 component